MAESTFAKGLEGVVAAESTICRIDGEMQSFLNRTIEKLGLSLRAYFKILKLARTIADLEASPEISIYHLTEAVQYRLLDRYNDLFSIRI